MPRTETRSILAKRFVLGAGLGLTSLIAAGCVADPYVDPYADPYADPYGPYHAPAYVADEGAETASQVCSIDSLTQAREEMYSEIERAGIYRARETGRREVREVESERPYGPQTETVELVHAFENDLDAAYRFATSSCQSYQMCMQHNGYNEQACLTSGERWQDAQRDFSSLSARLAEIRLEITQTCHGCVRVPAPYHRPYRGHRRSRHYDGCRDGYCERDRYYEDDCDSVLGDVFTTSTCDYPRRRHHHERRY